MTRRSLALGRQVSWTREKGSKLLAGCRKSLAPCPSTTCRRFTAPPSWSNWRGRSLSRWSMTTPRDKEDSRFQGSRKFPRLDMWQQMQGHLWPPVLPYKSHQIKVRLHATINSSIMNDIINHSIHGIEWYVLRVLHIFGKAQWNLSFKDMEFYHVIWLENEK